MRDMGKSGRSQGPPGVGLVLGVSGGSVAGWWRV